MFSSWENRAGHPHFEGSCNAQQQVEQGLRKLIGSQSSLYYFPDGGPGVKVRLTLSFSFLICEEPPESQSRELASDLKWLNMCEMLRMGPGT